MRLHSGSISGNSFPNSLNFNEVARPVYRSPKNGKRSESKWLRPLFCVSARNANTCIPIFYYVEIVQSASAYRCKIHQESHCVLPEFLFTSFYLHFCRYTLFYSTLVVKYPSLDCRCEIDNRFEIAIPLGQGLEGTIVLP